jgi:hypothetical protein
MTDSNIFMVYLELFCLDVNEHGKDLIATSMHDISEIAGSEPDPNKIKPFCQLLFFMR